VIMGCTADDFPKVLIEETEKLLQRWKHPDPYRPPTAPGGIVFNAAQTSILLSN